MLSIHYAEGESFEEENISQKITLLGDPHHCTSFFGGHYFRPLPTG